MFSRLKKLRAADFLFFLISYLVYACQSSSGSDRGQFVLDTPVAEYMPSLPVAEPVPSSSSCGCGAHATSGPGAVSVGGDGGTTVFRVNVPENVSPGEEFQVYAGNRIVRVRCPPDSRPGQNLQITVPAVPAGSGPPPQMFEVVVPKGVKPGQPFALLVGGVRVLVTCPSNASAGQKIRFQLPIGLGKGAAGNEAAQVKLSYDKDGWTRTIRVTDMKFQWVRMDDKGDVDLNKRFDVEKSAYVRKLDFLEGNDPRIREGIISLVPASEAVADSKIKSADNRDLVSYADIAAAQVKSFEEKTQWFQDTCAQLCVEWNEGHIRMNVRRDHLLSDSIDRVMSLTRKDLRKVWRFEFIGEMGIDAEGLAREWFQLVTEEIFDPDMGLWQVSAVNQMRMQIYPASEISYFRFLGRVMGKALFDRQLVAGHMVQYLYKHILGWPVSFADLELVDEEYLNYLKQLEHKAKMGDDLEKLCLNFTVPQKALGSKESVELVEGGADISDQRELPRVLGGLL